MCPGSPITSLPSKGFPHYSFPGRYAKTLKLKLIPTESHVKRINLCSHNTLTQKIYKHKNVLPRPIPNHLSIWNSQCFFWGGGRRTSKCKNGNHGGKNATCISLPVFSLVFRPETVKCKTTNGERKQVPPTRSGREGLSVKQPISLSLPGCIQLPSI